MTNLLVELLAAEEAVWAALETGDMAADQAALAPDFLGVYPDGFAGRDAHAAQLGAGPSIADYSLSQARAFAVGEAYGMLCYHARFRRLGRAQGEAMYVSSLWRRGPQGWQNVFSQDTPEGAPVP